MKNLINRYIYDVVRRLPEKERDEVSKELNSNIYDMLSDNAGENEIKNVLIEMGSPASLAEKYRQQPRYLISPEMYDNYLRALKIVLPLVGILVTVIGMIIGAYTSIADGVTTLNHWIKNVITDGISMGVSAAIQTLIWTTVGFVIAERVGDKSGLKSNWKLEDLPDEVPNPKGVIPLSDAITELITIVVLAVIAIPFINGSLPIIFTSKNIGAENLTIFAPSFLSLCIPFIVVSALSGIVYSVFKIVHRYWTKAVCISVVVHNIVSAAAFIFLITRQEIFSNEFISYMENIGKDTSLSSDADFIRFFETGGLYPIVVVIAIISVAVCVFDTAYAVYKTVRYKRI